MPEPRPERRRGPRFPARVFVSIKHGEGLPDTAGVSRDLSRSGIFLYTDSQISAGTELEMVLILPAEITQGEKQWVCCRASVIRVEDGEKQGRLGVAASIRSLEVLPEIPS